MTLIRSGDPSYDNQPGYEHIEVKTFNNAAAYYFLYNPSEISYRYNTDSYSIKFLNNKDREITKILRNTGIEISGRGMFVTFGKFRVKNFIGNKSAVTAAGQWKEFENLIKKQGYEDLPFRFINPLLGDERLVEFTNFQITQQPDPHIVSFTFTCKETGYFTKDEIENRAVSTKKNNAQYITQDRIDEINTNLTSHFNTQSQDWDTTKEWGLSGKVPDSTEYLAVDYFIEYQKSGEESLYNSRIEKLLEKNDKEIDLSTSSSNKLEAIDTSDILATHIVVSNDTLFHLALKYYKNSNTENINRIYNGNKDLIEKEAVNRGFQSSVHGKWLFPGTKLVIPKL